MINKEVILYHFQYKIPRLGQKEPSLCTSFGLDYSREDLVKGLLSESIPRVSDIKILGEISISNLLQILENDFDGEVYIPMKLKKKQFLNNILYTRDKFIKDEKDKRSFNEIIEKIK